MDTTCARNMAAPHRANIRNKRGDKNETRPALVHAARDVCVTTLASGGIHTALAPPSNSLLASARPELGVGRAAGRAGLGFNLDFNHPNDVALDPTTGNVYVTDCHNFLVRTIDPDGRVTTLAGSSRGCKDGQGRAAQFDTPVGVAVHHTGDIYVTDNGNHSIRKIDPDGRVTTLAGCGKAGTLDGPGHLACFHNPRGICVDPATGVVYVADTLNDRIRRVEQDGTVSTVAGSTKGWSDGPGRQAQFFAPYGVAVDPATGHVIVADTWNHMIRQIDSQGEHGVVVVVVAPGPPPPARTVAFACPAPSPPGP